MKNIASQIKDNFKNWTNDRNKLPCISLEAYLREKAYIADLVEDVAHLYHVNLTIVSSA